MPALPNSTGKVNPNWARWGFASLATMMKAVAEANNIPCLVEGLDERTTEFMDSSDRVEIRINGPFTRDLSVATPWYELLADMNALFVSRYENGKNKYDLMAILGAFQAAMDAPIPLFKLGKAAGDDGTCWAVLQPANKRGDAVRVMHFGQSDLTNRVKQCLVDAQYQLPVGWEPLPMNTPARSRRLNLRMPMETATSSEAKRLELQKQAKAHLRSFAKPKTQAEKLELEVAMIQARDGEAFKKHTETRADLPLRGVDYLSQNVLPDWSKHG